MLYAWLRIEMSALVLTLIPAVVIDTFAERRAKDTSSMAEGMSRIWQYFLRVLLCLA